MLTGTRYYSLLEKHRQIEKTLDAEIKRPLPDSLAVQELKREKLRLRDEMEALEYLLGPFLAPVRPPRELHPQA